MKYKKLTIYLWAVFFLLPILAHAHGVKGRISSGGIVVIAEYDTGEPMSYARVKISAPAAKLTFQSGRTDRNGRFCFFPDTPGEWKVVVDDEMGHRLEVPVSVNEAMKLETDEQTGRSAASSLSKYEKALIGICIIFGISGVLFLWRGKKERYK
ncbi:MAG: carboxypeptidase regulatory-like domain-containing protein [Deltaproteobacteria bacterium]|nr:carboxypeptidase regulatory-like domain-containing protein [Deltaproteobacteria bacterium]